MSEYENVTTVQFGAGSNEPSLAPRGHQPFSGGMTTYNVPVAETAPLVSSGSIQQNIGSVTTVGVNGTQSSGVQTFNTGDLTGNHKNFLATARSPGGFRVSGDLAPDSVVNYQGLEVNLETLEAMGVVKRSGNSYEIADGNGGNGQQQGNQQQQQQTKQNNLPEGVELFAQAVEAAVAQAIDPVPQAFYDSAVAKALETGLDGINFNELAFNSGMTPAEARQRAEVVSKAFSDQADSIAKASGINEPAEFWDWCNAERKGELMNARREMAFGRNTQSLRSLISDYYASVPPTTEALQKAGIPLRTDHSGQTVAFIRGNWMTPEAAAKAGLI